MSSDPTTVSGTEKYVIDEDGETLFREPEPRSPGDRTGIGADRRAARGLRHP